MVKSNFIMVASSVGGYVFWLVLLWLVLGLALAVGMAVVQERKIWLPKSLPSLSYWGMLKVALFNLVWCTACLVWAILIGLKFLFTLGQSDSAYEAHCIGEQFVAHACIWGFIGKVELKGVENLPNAKSKVIPAPVYVANHASQIDVGAVYFIKRRFKWIAKQSVLYLPGVGQLMGLSQHVFIQRSGKNKKSVSGLFAKSGKALMDGIPMFFFPQGTRRMAERLPFKDGAYIIAKNHQAPLIPLSVDIPRNAWNCAYPLSLLVGGSAPIVTITIHPAIPVTESSSQEELKNKSIDLIYSAVPTILQAEGTLGKEKGS